MRDNGPYSAEELLPVVPNLIVKRAACYLHGRRIGAHRRILGGSP
ncbi:MAG: hypothetical protein H6Q02_464 [Acidobacteria bacterium]|jgi:hypothetical protein|nr:hypothetical protein [Acidobacteriota bacterium]